MMKVIYSICMFFCVMANAQVVISVGDKTFIHSKEQRLSSILSSVETKDVIWAYAKLFRKNTVVVDSLIADYERLADVFLAKNPINSQANRDFSHLMAGIAHWRLAVPINSKVDADLSRLVIKHNPVVTAGEYELVLRKRPETVEVYGAVEGAGVYGLIDGMSLSWYVQQAKLTVAAEKDLAYVITPDGEIFKVGIAYWNKDNFSVPPGSQIFIPFSTDIFSNEIEKLNAVVARMASYRIIR